MSKVRRIVCCIIIIYGISTAWLDISDGYSKYNRNKEYYKTCKVEITKTDYITHKGARWAYFQYEQQEERVVCNFWENSGDIIEVAYDSDYNFIRKEICVDDSNVSEFFIYTIGIIAIIIDIMRSGNRNS